MADFYKLTAGKTLTATAIDGRIHVRSSVASAFTRSSVSFGPYLVDTDWLVDGGATVVLADHTTAFNALVIENDGAPDDATQAAISINPTGDDNAVIFTARAYGVDGNSITVAYVDPSANDAALAVSVFRQAITVSLATGEAGAIESTAAEVLAAIQADGAANELVTVALDETDTNFSDGSGVVTAVPAPALEGGAGTAIGKVLPGGLLIDTTGGKSYRNVGTLAAPAWGNVAAGADVPATVTVGLAASETTDGMDITITVKDDQGDAIASVFELEWWISESAIGAGLTADSYSGDVTTGTGTELQEIVSKKHYKGLTDANGVLGATAVASANPTDQYVAVRHPLTSKVVVSGASGTNWEGAA
jgi:hypothetical protein